MSEFLEMFLIIVVILVTWYLLGFIGFLIEAKRQGYTQFDSQIKSELGSCVVLGIITFVFMIGSCMVDWFNSFMDWLLKQMNKEKQ